MPDPVSTNGPVITSPIVLGGASPTVESPVVDGNPPAPEPEVKDPPAGGAVPDPAKPGEATDPAKAGDPGDPKPSTEPEEPADGEEVPEWLQKRINKEVKKRFEIDRELRAAKEDLAKAERLRDEALARAAKKTGDEDPDAEPKAGLTQEELDALVNERARELTAINRFNESCNQVAAAGKTEYTDWDDALKNLSLVGAIGKDATPEFLETAIELKDPHKVLHFLGTNLEEAERIVKLPPKRMALELARVEAKVNAAPVVTATVVPPVIVPVSKAPAPVIPVTNPAAAAGPLSLDDPNLSTEDFMALRAKQQDERRRRYMRN